MSNDESDCRFCHFIDGISVLLVIFKISICCFIWINWLVYIDHRVIQRMSFTVCPKMGGIIIMSLLLIQVSIKIIERLK